MDDLGRRPGFWVTLVEWGAAQNVSALTTLLASANYSVFEKIALYAEFTTNGGRIIANPSDRGTVTLTTLQKFEDVAAGAEGVVIVSADATNWSFTAQSDNPGVTTASVRFCIRAMPRGEHR